MFDFTKSPFAAQESITEVDTIPCTSSSSKPEMMSLPVWSLGLIIAMTFFVSPDCAGVMVALFTP